MTEILSQGPIFLLCLAFLLGVVVIIHELGHYWAGRWFGAAVESFSIGFGNSIYERKDGKGMCDLHVDPPRVTLEQWNAETSSFLLIYSACLSNL